MARRRRRPEVTDAHELGPAPFRIADWFDNDDQADRAELEERMRECDPAPTDQNVKFFRRLIAWRRWQDARR